MKRRDSVGVVITGVFVLTLVVAGIAYAAGYDLTAPLSAAAINGAILEVINPDDSLGSGLFDPFVRISTSLAVIRGYNTDYRPLQFDENNSGTFTRSRLLSAVPQVEVNGTLYREFQLDINQDLSLPDDSLLTLDTIELYESPYPELCGYPFDGSGGGHTGCPVAPDNNTATLVYDMDAGEDSFVVLDYANNEGAGKRDMRLLVPDANFNQDPNCSCGGVGCSVYITVYSKFGGDADPGDPNPTLQLAHGNNDGHEEWGVRPGLPVTELGISATGAGTVTLSWTPDPNGSGYSVYRSTEPFTGFGLLAADVLGGIYHDDGAAIGDPGLNHYYYVYASCGSGGPPETVGADVVGEFDFALVPGD